MRKQPENCEQYVIGELIKVTKATKILNIELPDELKKGDENE